MLPFGHHLLTLDIDGILKVWDIKTGTEYLEMTFNNEKTEVSALCHPSTYIDTASDCHLLVTEGLQEAGGMEVKEVEEEQEEVGGAAL
jgi:hypothetical protein